MVLVEVMGTFFQQVGQAAQLDRGQVECAFHALEFGNALVFSQVKDLEGSEADHGFQALAKLIASLIQRALNLREVKRAFGASHVLPFRPWTPETCRLQPRQPLAHQAYWRRCQAGGDWGNRLDNALTGSVGTASSVPMAGKFSVEGAESSCI
jgi:hypothetical protein